ncbi:MAG: efflux RND transporter permease subunit [Lacipirellulaceae bacterium]
MQRLADLFVRNRNAVGVALALVTVLAALGYVRPMRTQHPLERYETPIEEDPPTQTERVQSRFNLSGADAFLVVESDELFHPQTIAAVRRMVRGVEAVPFVDSVFWVDRVPILNVFGIADPLVPPDDASLESHRQAATRLREHPLAGQLVSDDGRGLLMPVVYDWLSVEAPRDTTRVVLEAAREAIAEGADPAAPIRVSLTGRAPLLSDQQSAFDRNQIVFQVIGYALALVLSAILFRGVAAVGVVAAAPALGVFWTLGLAKLIGVPSNPLADIVMPVLIAMVGLTDGVHLLIHVRRRRAAGDAPIAAARSAIAEVGLACWLTAITTSVGFASLLLAQSDYVRDFGMACSFGVIVGFVAVVTFIPWVCSSWVGRYVEQGHERDLTNRGTWLLEALVDFLLRHRVLVSLLALAVTVTLGFFAFRLAPDNRMKSAMPASSDSYRALEYCDRRFGGIEFFRVEVSWPEEVDGKPFNAADPRVLAAVREVERLVANEPLLSRPLSVRTMLASFPGDADDLETQATFLSLLPRELRANYYDPAERTAIVVVRMQDQGIAKYTPVFDRIEAAFARLSEGLPGFRFELAGQPIRVSRDLYQIVSDLRASLGSESVLIILVLGLFTGSAMLGVVSIIPNLFPLVFTGAVLYAIGQPLDMSSVCSFVVCLGIVVDDTIHFLSRYRQELAIDGEVHGAIRRAFVGAGPALVVTSIILCCGFGTMLLSDLPGHRTFAGMAVTTIAAAVFGDLLMLPALLAVAHPWIVRRLGVPRTARAEPGATLDAGR